VIRARYGFPGFELLFPHLAGLAVEKIEQGATGIVAWAGARGLSEVGTVLGSGADHVIRLVGVSCAGVWLLSARMACVAITGY